MEWNKKEKKFEKGVFLNWRFMKLRNVYLPKSGVVVKQFAAAVNVIKCHTTDVDRMQHVVVCRVCRNGVITGSSTITIEVFKQHVCKAFRRQDHW